MSYSDTNGVNVPPVAYRYKLCGAGGTLLSATNPAKGDRDAHGIYANGVYDVEPLQLAGGVPGTSQDKPKGGA